VKPPPEHLVYCGSGNTHPDNDPAVLAGTGKLIIAAWGGCPEAARDLAGDLVQAALEDWHCDCDPF
jgi:hypothetical protein